MTAIVQLEARACAGVRRPRHPSAPAERRAPTGLARHAIPAARPPPPSIARRTASSPTPAAVRVRACGPGGGPLPVCVRAPERRLGGRGSQGAQEGVRPPRASSAERRSRGRACAPVPRPPWRFVLVAAARPRPRRPNGRDGARCGRHGRRDRRRGSRRRPALALARCDARLIVVGSRGRGPVRGALLGSVSASLAASAPAPVLVVPDTAELLGVRTDIAAAMKAAA